MDLSQKEIVKKEDLLRKDLVEVCKKHDIENFYIVVNFPYEQLNTMISWYQIISQEKIDSLDDEAMKILFTVQMNFITDMKKADQLNRYNFQRIIEERFGKSTTALERYGEDDDS